MGVTQGYILYCNIKDLINKIGEVYFGIGLSYMGWNGNNTGRNDNNNDI